MKVLITGATGFLGSWLSKAICKKSWDTRALIRPNSDTQNLNKLNINLFKGDVTNLESFKKAAQGVDIVFHLAGQVSHLKSQFKSMEAVNIKGTAHAIEVCKIHKAKLIHISSVVAVGASSTPKVLNEQSFYNPSLSKMGYFYTKKQGEILVQEASKKGQISAVILNPSTIYGAGDMQKQSRSVQLRVAQGKFPFTPSGGVSVVDVESVVQACLTAVTKGREGERYILGGENITIKKLFYLIAQHAGVKPPFIYLNNFILKTAEQLGTNLQKLGILSSVNCNSAYLARLYHWFDSSKAQQELGFSPLTATQSIKNSIKSWKQKKI